MSLPADFSRFADLELTEAKSAVRKFVEQCRAKGQEPTFEFCMAELCTSIYKHGESDEHLSELMRAALYGWAACDEIWHGGKP